MFLKGHMKHGLKHSPWRTQKVKLLTKPGRGWSKRCCSSTPNLSRKKKVKFWRFSEMGNKDPGVRNSGFFFSPTTYYWSLSFLLFNHILIHPVYLTGLLWGLTVLEDICKSKNVLHILRHQYYNQRTCYAWITLKNIFP